MKNLIVIGMMAGLLWAGCGSDAKGTAGGAGSAGASGGDAGSSGGTAGSSGGGAGSGGSAGGGAGSGGSAADCVMNPMAHVEIINACTDATKIKKMVNLPLLNADGSLPPLP